MEKQYSLFTVPNWIKWTVSIILVILLGVISYLIYTYDEVQDNKVSGFSQSKEIALSDTDLVSISEVRRFHGNEYYHVVLGTTENGDSGIAYIPINEEEQVQYFNSETFLTKEKMLNEWGKTCSACSLTGINYGIDKEQPLWEIKYIDSEDRLVFDYYTAKDGSSYEHFRLQRSLF
ncbi:cell wall elongation regulator TseB-like domain-containing protein [Aquibacillus saliphilus]|uniref:cell wall elongation regulator TseB-like domain-containing protein n=1 Tax=Aquibacillus saliphilus TaxID=1909422 RepID=UPI001CF0CFD0|nr:DUF5590 domain-containing protein [Aquibacillus saliphilus]